MRLVDRLLGQPLSSLEEGGQKIGVFVGVPSLGLNGFLPSPMDLKPRSPCCCRSAFSA